MRHRSRDGIRPDLTASQPLQCVRERHGLVQPNLPSINRCILRNDARETMNRLAEILRDQQERIELLRDKLVAMHETASVPQLDDYPLPRLKMQIADALSTRWGDEDLKIQFHLIDREQFGGDLTLKFPQLLRDGGPRKFVREHMPWILQVLSDEQFASDIVEVQTKSIYINLLLSDRWLLNTAQAVVDAGEFGRNATMAERKFVVDYSSPNAAKALHAGHIRSTIVGHVLCNLYEACGALVYRVNHINDLGGFGFILEGHYRFADKFPVTLSDNERLIETYRIRRALERIVNDGQHVDELSPDDHELMARYLPEAVRSDDLSAQFTELTAAANARFAALEAGKKEEVELWRTLVAHSLESFDEFYDTLGIHIDFVIGESFYLQAGHALVDDCLRSGKALVYTQQEATSDLVSLDEKLAEGVITEAEHNHRRLLIAKDVGAIVIPLDNGERYIVRRADGRSIYATRDLGAVLLRRRIFDVTDLVYVVGQEQQVHFDRLFRAAYSIGIASPEELRFKHLYFGFYVDAKTGKKLASRDSASSVTQLLSAAMAHFRAILSNRIDHSASELAKTAQQLAVGSLIFNDLRKNIRAPVEIDAEDFSATISGFEKSGGAYVVYAAVRAGSILRRHGRAPTHASNIHDFSLDDQEVKLLLLLQQIPEIVAEAAHETDVSVLVRHLLEIANAYNSYYVRAPVLLDGEANPSRLLITQAVHQALRSGLAICHVECPTAI